MNIALIGYGKMGREIEAQALSRNHKIILKVDVENASSFSNEELAKADVAIEFSTPHTAYDNILKCFQADVPVVVGTTGWLDKLEDVKKVCAEKDQSLFYSSNFSIGVNIFFEINKKLAQLMMTQEQYEVSIEEIHHTQKLDSPSGTAVTLGNDLIKNIGRKKSWVNISPGKQKQTTDASQLLITSVRTENVPGTHTISYSSDVDNIEIKHTAHSRKGFASGALMAAEWLPGKKGIFTMQDLLKL